MEYTVEYFIEKFEGIPEEEWCIGIQQNELGQRCAFGHCLPIEQRQMGYLSSGRGNETPEGKSLKAMFEIHFKSNEVMWSVAYINNGKNEMFQQPTPKQRILAALYEIRDKQQPKPATPPIPVYEPIEEPKKQGRQYTTVVIDRGIIELKNIDSLKPVLN